MEKSKRSRINLIAAAAGIVIAAGLFFFAAYRNVSRGSSGVLKEGLYNAGGYQVEVRQYGSLYRMRVVGEEELYITAAPFAGVGINYFRYDGSQEFDIVKEGDTYSLYNGGHMVASGWRFDG